MGDKIPWKTCVDRPARHVDALSQCVDSSVEITFGTFMRNVDPGLARGMFRGMGYAVGREKGLRIEDDYAVSFHKGTIAGEKTYFIVWSAIEHFFLDPGSIDRLENI